jgi:N-acetylglucosamine-6-phosphate deacetylase
LSADVIICSLLVGGLVNENYNVGRFHMMQAAFRLTALGYNFCMSDLFAFDPLTHLHWRVTDDGTRVHLAPAEDGVAPDCYLMQGFCDLQVNGAFGVDINAPDLTVESLRYLCERLLAEGVTAWLPTVITAPIDAILRQLAIVRQACEQDDLCAATIAGIHLEGPFLSPQEGARGAHDAGFLLAPDPTLFERFQAAAGGRICLVTLAPELPGAIDFIRSLAEQGVIPAIGHSLADENTLQQAVAAGARLSTHLGNGLPALLPRHDNPFLHQLADDALMAGVIFDGHHLPPALRRIILRAKGVERLIMVSDATRLTGMPPGRYTEAVGGEVELSTAGRLSLAGTPYLAGAARTLAQDAALMWFEDQISLASVLRMTVENPRRLLGCQSDSLVLFSVDETARTITIHLTALQGKVCYRNEKGANP